MYEIIEFEKLRFFTYCEDETSFNKVKGSPFIRVGDIVLYNDESYIYCANGEFTKVGKADKWDTISFFHRYNIGDIINIAEIGGEAKVIDIQVHYKDYTAFYVLDISGKVMKVQVVAIDMMAMKPEDTPLSVLTFGAG